MEKTQIVPTLEEMVEIGVHLGHYKKHRNTYLERLGYIFDTHEGLSILNLEKALPLFENAVKFFQKKGKEGARFLFVGITPQTKNCAKEIAEKTGGYYVCNKWVGGILTNWDVISKRISKISTLDKEMKMTDTYTRKEINGKAREKKKIKFMFEGFENMPGLPDVVVVLDCYNGAKAVQEATRMKIPVVGIINSNASPVLDYPIIGNDNNINSVYLILKYLTDAILSGMKVYMKNKTKKTPEGSKDQKTQEFLSNKEDVRSKNYAEKIRNQSKNEEKNE